MSPSSTKRGSINLTALGSAAVIAIYSAGYMRTRAAAKRFDTTDTPRRSVPTASQLPSEPQPQLVIADTALASVRPETAVALTPLPVKVKKPKKTATDTQAIAVVVPAPAPAPAPVADSTKTPTDTAKALKDGIYTGWGTSRHGDIEAAVEIKDGRIINAIITQCLTRYSCSRIAAIIPQVVERQSANVDFVSGATQSSDAFYYAVVEALSKAK